MAKKGTELDLEMFVAEPGKKAKLADIDCGSTKGISNKAEGKKSLAKSIDYLSEAQAVLWANMQYSVVIILQALDAAGKDGTIKHVMSGVNPQGCEVHAFKAPSEEERMHHFLWRPMRVLPARGKIAIFNRSYYEEVLVVRVHPHFLDSQWLPERLRGKDKDKLWNSRYEDINKFEKLLHDHGVSIIKFFLHVSKQEQKKRFIERLENPKKQWKFSEADFEERKYWSDYQKAYNDMISATSTVYSPWYIIPADHKWYMRAAVAEIITKRINNLGLKWPSVSKRKREKLEKIKSQIIEEAKTKNDE